MNHKPSFGVCQVFLLVLTLCCWNLLTLAISFAYRKWRSGIRQEIEPSCGGLYALHSCRVLACQAQVSTRGFFISGCDYVGQGNGRRHRSKSRPWGSSWNTAIGRRSKHPREWEGLRVSAAPYGQAVKVNLAYLGKGWLSLANHRAGLFGIYEKP